MKWVRLSTWRECLQLSENIPAFAGLCSDMMGNKHRWGKFATCDDPYHFLDFDLEAEEETETGKNTSIDTLRLSYF